MKRILGVLLGIMLCATSYAWDGQSSRGISGRRTVTTPGTAVQLSVDSTPCKRIYFTALTADVGTVFIGGPNVLASPAASTAGTPLTAGQSIILPLWDLEDAWIDANAANDGGTWTCFQ